MSPRPESDPSCKPPLYFGSRPESLRAPARPRPDGLPPWLAKEAAPGGLVVLKKPYLLSDPGHRHSDAALLFLPSPPPWDVSMAQ